MRTYADPRRCPGCGEALTPGTAVCGHCLLDLRGPVGEELWRTLQRADALLAELAVQSRQLVTTGAPTPSAVAGNALPTTPPVAPRPVHPAERGVRPSSVPKILLGLGALCLLVAGLVFLAVTWSVMGVGGRTATLVGFTVATGGLAAWAARRGLRGATESLGLVALGLAMLDLAGARAAGWLGDPSDAGFLVLSGVYLLCLGTAAAVAAARTPAGGLVVGELTAAGGALVLGLGLMWLDWPVRALGELMAVLTTLAVAALMALPNRAGVARLAVAVGGCSAVAALTWVALLVAGLARLGSEPTMTGVWLRLDGWAVAAAAAVAAGVAAVRLLPLPLRLIGAGAGALAAALFATAPAFDEPATTVTLAMTLVALAAAAVTLLPRPWGVTSLGAAVLAAVPLGLQAGWLGVLALARYADAAGTAWSGSTAGRLPAAPDEPGLAAPWLLPLCVLTLAVLGAAYARLAPRPAPGPRAVRRWATAATALLLLSVVGALLLHPVPVWLPLGVLVAAGAGLTAAALLDRTRPTYPAAALACLAAAVPLAWFDEALSVATLAVVVGAATALHVGHPRGVVADTAGALLGPAVAGLVLSAGALAGADDQATALTGLLLLGALVLARPSHDALPALELGTAVGIAGLAVAGVATAADQPTWAAVYLTVAGVVASAMALLRPDRRQVGWLGGLLLVLASWVRLADLGVDEPEPYTLPAGVALLALGLWRLRRDPRVGTHRALGAGLGLVLAPSLLWVVLADPAGWRPVALGAGCLLLVVAGAQARWSAPLLYGAAAGLLLVVRESAPYLGASVPRWALIGTAGAVLIALGVTWEQRLRDARTVSAYLRRLR